MIDSRNVQKAGLGYTIGNILVKGIVFLSLPLFSRLLGTSDFGVYNNYLAYEGIICSILGLGFYSSIKKAYLEFKDDFEKFFSSIISFLCIVFIVVLIAAIVLNEFITKFTNFSLNVIAILFAQSFGSAVIQLYASKLNMYFKYKSYLAISICNSVGNVLLSVILILFVFPNERSLGRIYGTAIPYIVIGLLVVVLSFVKGKCFLRKNFLKFAISFGLPLIPHVISQYILNQSDRLIISALINDGYSGIYSFAYNICSILFIVYQSLDSAWQPWSYLQIDSDAKNEHRIAAQKYIVFGLVLFIGFICLAPDVYKLAGSKDYYEGITLIYPLALSMFFQFLYYAPVNLEYYHKKTFIVSIIAVFCAALNIVLNFWFIPIYGFAVAAYTTLFAYAVMFICHFIIALKFNIRQYYNLKLFIISIGVAILIAALFLVVSNNIVGNYIVRYCSLTILLVFSFFYFKNELFNFLRGRK